MALPPGLTPLRTVGAAVLAVGLAAPLTFATDATGATGSTGASNLSITKSSVVVTMRGNGHGHGLSQYGAQGAALAGLSAQRIAAFYYPGTRISAAKTRWIRVRLSSVGSTVTVVPSTGLYVWGMKHTLPTSGVRRYRLVANSGTGTALQRLGTAAGAAWQTVYPNLADRATFHQSQGRPIRAVTPTGSSYDYRGVLLAARVRKTGSAGGVMPINVVSLDAYTAGVVPREMPISWRPAAVGAQAIAARTYAKYAMEHAGHRKYDICDTTMCQVYGGAAKYNSRGKRLWTDAPKVARATTNQVLTYRGEAIFAQFSASNGGWTADGGQPYLVSKRDPYDNARSGDPYLRYRRTVSTASIAHYYGLAKLTRIEVAGRTAGGRITTAYVSGLTAAKHAKRVRTDGANLSWAVGAGTTWLSFGNP